MLGEWCRREISHDMFKLWYLAESDLLREGNSYRLTNTGQGLNRVQQVRVPAKWRTCDFHCFSPL